MSAPFSHLQKPVLRHSKPEHMITFPVPEAIVESWGSMGDITDKCVSIKLVGSSAGATLNRKLSKRDLTLRK